MEQRNIKILSDIQKKPGNGECADCRSKELEYASYNLGIFICRLCAEIHNQMGSHISKTKHLKLDHWEDSQVERMKQVGNIVAKTKYEARVPTGFRKPVRVSSSTSAALPVDPIILNEHWITSKYKRQEFISSSNSNYEQQVPLRPYLTGVMDSFLMKKGREDPRYFPRRFILDKTTLRYYVKEKSNPKAVIRLIDLDVSLNPVKCVSVSNARVAPSPPSSSSSFSSSSSGSSCLQLSYLKDGSTRHLYVFHDDAELVMQWYQALRIAKLEALRERATTENVNVTENMLLTYLPQDSLMEGYLWKAGPSPSYAHRRRWFTLSSHRKLMYHIDPIDAYPKGEIFLGSSGTNIDLSNNPTIISAASKLFDCDIKKPESLSLAGYKVTLGGFRDDNMDPQRWVFTLDTPYRTFVLAAETQVERDKWVIVLTRLLKMDLTLRDVATCSLLVRKRNGSALSNLSVSNPLSGLLNSSSSSTPTAPSIANLSISGSTSSSNTPGYSTNSCTR